MPFLLCCFASKQNKFRIRWVDSCIDQYLKMYHTGGLYKICITCWVPYFMESNNSIRLAEVPPQNTYYPFLLHTQPVQKNIYLLNLTYLILLTNILHRMATNVSFVVQKFCLHEIWQVSFCLSKSWCSPLPLFTF